MGGSNCSWAPGPGFAPGNFVLWAENGNGAGSGPLSLSFLHVFGAGLYIQATAAGQFTAQIMVYNGATLLATLSELSNANGDGIFIGALDTVSDITRIVVSLASCSGFGADCNDFGVNSLLLNTIGRTVPEPMSLSLLLLGAAGLAFFRRSRRAGLTVAKEEKTARDPSGPRHCCWAVRCWSALPPYTHRTNPRLIPAR